MKKLSASSPYTKFIAAASAFIWTIAIATSARGAQLQEARVTQVVNDVKLLLEQAAPRPAAISDFVRHGTAVRTGTQSRSELTFADLTITRLGANTIFSFKEGTREMNLVDGAILFQVPKGSGGATIRTVGVTAAITGTTGIGEYHPATTSHPLFSKWLCLEGTFRVILANGQSVELGPGKMVTTDGKSFSKVSTFNIGQLVKTSLFFIGFDQPLPIQVLNLIALEEQRQAELLLASQLINTTTQNPLNPLTIVNVINQAIVAQTSPSASVSPPPPPPPTTPPPTTPPPPTPPPPTPPPPTPPPPTPPPPTPPPPTPPPPTPPPPTPSKFGTPSVITSPVPYVITSGTTITTDPSITTNGVTDYGKIYRDPTNDGPFSLWAFGSTSAFDNAINLDTEFFADPNHLPIAAFKFQNLSLNGNPTIDISNGGATKLALIGVNGITSGPPGGVLTFTGLDLLVLATVNGSINLTSDVSFQDLNELAMYARGAGSDLTIDSPISNIGALGLAAEGSIQLTNPGTMSVGEFEATAGNNLTLQIGGSLLTDGKVRLNTLVLPGTTVASGANLTLNITGDYTNGSTTEFSRLRVRNEGAQIGTGGNIAVSIGGDLTTTALGGDFALVVQNTNGQIDNGGNITLMVDGSVSTQGQLSLLVENYDFSANPAGRIGTGGNISVAAGGDLTADSISAVINNGNGGTIGSGASLIFNVSGALTTVQNGTDYFGDSSSLSLFIRNRYDDTLGSTIGGDATLELHADSASIGGNLNAIIIDRGGTIDGNALLNFNVTHDIAVQGDAFWSILNGEGPDVEVPIGGTIHGNANLQLSAANLSANSIFFHIDNRNTGATGPGGVIDSSANLRINLSGNLTTQTDATFLITNGFVSVTPVSGSGGTIGQDAVLNLNANSLSIGGGLDTRIGNQRTAGNAGGTIGGNATINLVVVGGIGALDDSQSIDNGGGIIGSNAAITVSAASLATTDTAPGALSASINNSAGGSIGGSASINFDLLGNLTSASDAIFSIDNSNGGTISGAANVAVNVTNDVTAPGGVTLQILNGNSGHIVTGADVFYSVGGSTSTTDLIEYIDNSNGGVIDHGGNVMLHTVGPVMLDGALVLEIDNFNGGTINNGANVTAHFVGDLTDTAGQFHSLNWYVLNGSGFFNPTATGGTIGTGGNINLTFDGNASTTGTSTTGAIAAEIQNGNGGSIATGGNISITVGGNLAAGPLFLITENQGGHLGTGGNMTLQVAGDITTLGDANFQIFNNDNGSGPGAITGNATINVSAANVSTAGFLFDAIANFGGGNIGGNANLNFSLTGDLTAQADLTFGIGNNDGGHIGGDAAVNVSVTTLSTTSGLTAFLGSYGTQGGGQIGGNASINVVASSGITAGADISLDLGNNHGSGTPAGMIGGNAMVDVTAGHISAGGFIHSTIDNEGGTIGGDAGISFDLSGTIASQNHSFFTIIFNEDNGNGSGPGMIGGNATIDVSANSISIGGNDLFHSTIFNEDGGMIGGNAAINFNISGDITTPDDIIFNVSNSGGTIGLGAGISLAAATISANSFLAQIDNTEGSIGGNAAINMNVSGTATVTNDATVAIYGSDGAKSAAINLNGGNYNVGGTFLSYIDGNGTITFNNASMHADVLKAGVFGTNGALNIGGGMLSADSTLKLYAPGSNGQLNFMSNVTLGGNSLKILAANSITIFNNIVVTIGGKIAADVYTNNANYTGFGGNGTTTGTFAGAGANNPQPLSSAPPFGPASPVKLTTRGNIPTGTGVPPQSRPARTPAPGGNITSRTRIPPPSPSNALTGGKIADVRRANNVINVRSSDELLSLLDDAAPGPGGKITIPPSKNASNSKNSNRIDAAGRLNAGSRLNADRRAMNMRTASSSLMRRSPQ